MITDHYENGEIECIDYLWDNMPLEAFVGGLEWNVKKYMHRWRYKENPVKDLRKARDYLNVMIDVMEGCNKPQFKEWREQAKKNPAEARSSEGDPLWSPFLFVIRLLDQVVDNQT